MFFSTGLEEKIFNVHKYIECDELQIISGYLSPKPIEKLKKLPINSTVVYGMYGSELIAKPLHEALLQNHINKFHKVLYSNIPIDSKCYVWKLKGKIVYALIGSADFSTSGLSVSFRESLAEITKDSYDELEDYVTYIISNSIESISKGVKTISSKSISHYSNEDCKMVLYNPQTNEVPIGSGLNWGHSVKGHTNIGDSYITIRTSHLKQHPKLFSKKQITNLSRSGKGRSHRQSEPVELIWDDGFVMEALLEGSQPMEESRYPKQISSFPSKNILGIYLRNRMGLSEGSLITMRDLENYGRTDIKISLLKKGIYYVDFSIDY